MRQVVILSGKGGTGKTSLSASLVHLASGQRKLVMTDADVDAANLDLLLEAETCEENEYMGGKLSEIDQSLCTSCGRCLEVCRFDAVFVGEDGTYSISPTKCEGCSSCLHQCPAGAIFSNRRMAGRWFRSSTPYGTLFHAEMLAGEENSGKLVSTVREASARYCDAEGCSLLLIDGPPGIGCPVIASCTGTDLALICTEPGVSAIHDLQRILETAHHFGVKTAVCINKWDINAGKSKEIESVCQQMGIPVLGRIPFDEMVIRSVSAGRPVTLEYPSSPSSVAIGGIWSKLREMI
jgi:MinD superfamily P-loop ATPase